MSDKLDQAVRKQLIETLNSGGAHASFDDAVDGLPAKLQGRTPTGMPHSPWMLLEHLRIAQADILDFCVNPKYVAPKWPEGYWPKTSVPPNEKAWDKSVAAFQRDLKAMQDLVKNPKTDLVAKIPWGEGQTILREALLVADHNAYHLAQIIDVRRLLGVWKE
jgi:hypothetical protein